MSPIIRLDRNGQGWLVTYRTWPTRTPDSSNTSRRAASSIVSPGSTKPARAEYMPGFHDDCRPSRMLPVMPHHHDHHGIGAREMVHAAAGAVAAIAGIRDLQLHGAVRAIAAPLVPLQQRARLGQHAELLRRECFFHRQAAQVAQALRRFDAACEPWRTLRIESQKHRWFGGGIVGRHQRAVLQQSGITCDADQLRIGALALLQHPFGIRPVIGAAVERVQHIGKWHGAGVRS